MPALSNRRHELFAQALANGKTLEEAQAEAGYSVNRSNAHALKSKPYIANRVSELLDNKIRRENRAEEKATEKLALSKEWVLAKLIENAERAMAITPAKNQSGEEIGVYQYQGNVANRALELLGKEIGMFIDRKESGAPGEFAELDADGVKRAIAERLGLVEPRDGTARTAGIEGILRGQSKRVH